MYDFQQENKQLLAELKAQCGDMKELQAQLKTLRNDTIDECAKVLEGYQSIANDNGSSMYQVYQAVKRQLESLKRK